MQKPPDGLMDIIKDPNKYGVPTFAQYKKNPSGWKDSIDKMLGSADASSISLKTHVVKQEYVIRGRVVDTPEEIEHIAREEGIDLMNCDMCPQVLPYWGDSTKFVISVEFKEKLLWTPDQIS